MNGPLRDEAEEIARSRSGAVFVAAFVSFLLGGIVAALLGHCGT